MGAPEFPEKFPTHIKLQDAVIQILLSVAVEELALAALINGEAEKVQKLAEEEFPKPKDLDEVIDFQFGVSTVLEKVLIKQNQLIGKLHFLSRLVKQLRSWGEC